MINYKKVISYILIVFFVSGLSIVNFSSGNVTVSDAQARENPYYMTSEYCWYDGQPFWICRVGPGTCHVGSQDCCGEECDV